MTTIVNRIKHFFGRHKYYCKEELSDESRKMGCKICKREWLMSDRLKLLIPWDADMERLYRVDLKERVDEWRRNKYDHYRK